MPTLKPWQQAIGYILIGVILTTGIYLISRPPRGTPITLTPVAPHQVVVQVDGEVLHPGLYQLIANSRVQDAINSAGGVTSLGTTGSLNLARIIKDGEKITVPAISDSIPESSKQSSLILVDLNQATLKDLDALPGIGETRAQAIIDYRSENGSFVSVEELLQVPGISQDVFKKIKDLVIVQ